MTEVRPTADYTSESSSPLLIALATTGVLGFFIFASVVGGIVAWRWTAPPAPQPVPGPQPVVATIGELIPEPARPAVAQFYRDLASVAELGLLGDREQFLRAHNVGTLVLDEAIGDPDLGEASPAIQRYLVEALGTEPGPTPSTLPASLRALAEQID